MICLGVELGFYFIFADNIIHLDMLSKDELLITVIDDCGKRVKSQCLCDRPYGLVSNSGHSSPIHRIYTVHIF